MRAHADHATRRAPLAPPAAAAAPPAEPFEPEFVRAIERDVLAPITDRWFRATVVGRERIPAEGPLILCSNHSGNAFPYDGIVLDALLWRLDGTRPEAKIRTVYEHELSLVWWMRPFGIANFWRRGGGVDMTFDNFERLLERGDRVLYFPEGVPGIGKGFNRRYQLQPFRSSFVLLGARHRAPVIPLYIVNGEWLHPFGYTLRPIDWLFQRLFHVPFLPLPLGLVAIVLPWVWFLAFPARLTFVVGEPLDVEAALRAEGITALDHPDHDALRRAAERLRRQMQAELTRHEREHGRPRYGFRELWRRLREPGTPLWRILPTGWPAAFLRHVRDLQRPPARSRLHALLRDWDLVGFWLPFGWPLLSLARAFRRPPCGHRGRTRAQVREHEGAFTWRLAERPLPPRPSPSAPVAPR
jgi:1-acyl-sn-glycerol-3-phosphate acyltransferase